MILVLLITVAEAILIFKLSATYFRIGLVVFRKTVKINRPCGTIPAIVGTEANVPESTWPGFVFKEIADQTFAFRERMFSSSMSYTPVMHGTLEFDQKQGLVQVSGRVNLSALAFLAFITVSASESAGHDMSFGFIAGLILLVIYLIQFSRYSQIAIAASEAWNRQALQHQPETELSQEVVQTGIDYFSDRKSGNGLFILFIFAVMIAISVAGSWNDPFRDLVHSFKTGRTLRADSIMPSETSIHSRDMRSSRFKGSIEVQLSQDGIQIEPTFPTKLFYSTVMIPTTEVTACSETCSGDGHWNVNLLIEKTSTQIDLDSARQVVDWCWNNKIPMATGKQRRDWLYTGAPLPDKGSYAEQLESKDAYYNQARQSCLGY